MSWCPYCEDKGGWFTTSYVCKLDNEYIPASYLKYCKNVNISGDCPNYKQYGPSSSSSCFITTIACRILGKDDKDPVMEKLRWFRNNVLQKSEEYYDILKAYDTLGPAIVCGLTYDEERKPYAESLYSLLERITSLIDKKEYSSAIEKYMQMNQSLVNRYGLDQVFARLKQDNFGYKEGEFNPEKAGHGIKLINPDMK